jgi:aspartokinase-like uncharacterized kinase
MMPDLIVKIGGSHARSALLRPWLRAIAATEARIVIVPGGGPFADAVRAAQSAMGFGEQAAHEMALLAMAQYGRAIADLDPRFAFTDSETARQAALDAGRIAVWSPWPELRDAPGIPPSWDVTSDSIALWLAARLNAPLLLLVKHRSSAAAPRCADLVRDGLLDAAFPAFLSGFHGAVRIAGPDELPAGGIDLSAPPGPMLHR